MQIQSSQSNAIFFHNLNKFLREPQNPQMSQSSVSRRVASHACAYFAGSGSDWDSSRGEQSSIAIICECNQQQGRERGGMCGSWSRRASLMLSASVVVFIVADCDMQALVSLSLRCRLAAAVTDHTQHQHIDSSCSCVAAIAAAAAAVAVVAYKLCEYEK